MPRPSFGPGMISGSVETDIVTGLPRPEYDRIQRDSEKQRLQAIQAKAMDLRSALTTPHNQEVLGVLCEELEQRIDALIANDPPCQALLAVLGRFVSDLSLGRRAAKELLDPLYQSH